MTDEQCQFIIDAIDRLTEAVNNSSEKLAGAIEDIYFPTDTRGIEKRLQLLCEIVEDGVIKI